MNNFESLDYEESFEDGYVIVEGTLFEVENSCISDSWELSGKTIEEKVKDARKQAELDDDETIYYDDENCYNKNIILDEGRFVSPYEVQMTEDEESFCEYCNNH